MPHVEMGGIQYFLLSCTKVSRLFNFSWKIIVTWNIGALTYAEHHFFYQFIQTKLNAPKCSYNMAVTFMLKTIMKTAH